MSFKVNDIHFLKKIIIKSKLFKEKCSLLSISICQLYSAKMKSSYFYYSDIEGALTLIYDYTEKCCKFRIYDLQTFDILLEIKLAEKFQSFYSKIRQTFHCLQISEGFFGFLFPSSAYADTFFTMIESLQKKTKEDLDSDFTNSLKAPINSSNFDTMIKSFTSSWNLSSLLFGLSSEIKFNILLLCNFMNNLVYNENTNRFEYYGSKQTAMEFVSKYKIEMNEVTFKNLGNVYIGDNKYFANILSNHIVNDVGITQLRHFEKREKMPTKRKVEELMVIKEEYEDEVGLTKSISLKERQTFIKAPAKSSKLLTQKEIEKEEEKRRQVNSMPNKVKKKTPKQTKKKDDKIEEDENDKEIEENGSNNEGNKEEKKVEEGRESENKKCKSQDKRNSVDIYGIGKNVLIPIAKANNEGKSNDASMPGFFNRIGNKLAETFGSSKQEKEKEKEKEKQGDNSDLKSSKKVDPTE